MSQRISLAQNDFTERQIELKSINSMRAEVAFFCFFLSALVTDVFYMPRNGAWYIASSQGIC